MKVDETPLKDWIASIRKSEVALPRFQRYKEWKKKITEGFLTSVVRGFPTGATLILERGEKFPFPYRFIEGAPSENSKEPYKLLMDGQQRLTAVWKSLNNLYEERTYLLNLENEQPFVTSEKRREKNSKKYPLWVDNPKKCWERKIVPLYLLNPDDDDIKVVDWCEEAIEDSDEQRRIINKLFDIKGTISSFLLPELRLDRDTDPNDAIDIFIKLNTSYVELSTFDIVVARTEAHTHESLHDELNRLKRTCPEIKNYINPEKYVLDVVALLQNKRPSKTNKREKLNYKKLIADWSKVISGTNELISFLEQERLFDGKRLPTEVILAPLAALFTFVPTHPDKRGNDKRILKKYLWRSFFTDRYETTTNERIYKDYKALKDTIKGISVSVPCFDEEKYPMPSEEDLKLAGWPTKKDRLGRAILSLTVKKGARNFADDDEISKRNVKNREYHHLYPSSFLSKKGIDKEQANKALNCALIRWEDNRTISDKPPLKYLLQRSKADNLGERQIKKRLKSHIVDYTSMIEGDYEKFLNKRASDIVEGMEKVCEGLDIR